MCWRQVVGTIVLIPLLLSAQEKDQKKAVESNSVVKKAGVQPSAPGAHSFTSPTVDVKIEGYRWINPLILNEAMQEQRLPARGGERWLGLKCRFTLKGGQSKLEDPAKLVNLKYNARVISPFGATSVGSMSMLMAWVSSNSLVEVIFSVPATAPLRSLLISAFGGSPISAASLPAVNLTATEGDGPSSQAQGADVDQTSRDCVAALQSYYDTKTKSEAVLKEVLEKVTKAMESGNMSELQALQSRSQSAAAAAGASRASYQDKREKLHQLTLSKDVKTRSAALVAYRKLVAQEKRVAGGLPPAAN